MLKRFSATLAAGLVVVFLLSRLNVNAAVAVGVGVGVGGFGSVLLGPPTTSARSTWAWAILSGAVMGATAALLHSWLY